MNTDLRKLAPKPLTQRRFRLKPAATVPVVFSTQRRNDAQAQRARSTLPTSGRWKRASFGLPGRLSEPRHRRVVAFKNAFARMVPKKTPRHLPRPPQPIFSTQRRKERGALLPDPAWRAKALARDARRRSAARNLRVFASSRLKMSSHRDAERAPRTSADRPSNFASRSPPKPRRRRRRRPGAFLFCT